MKSYSNLDLLFEIQIDIEGKTYSETFSIKHIDHVFPVTVFGPARRLQFQIHHTQANIFHVKFMLIELHVKFM